MRRTSRKHHPHAQVHELGALQGRRNKQAASNSMKFLARVEGVEIDGHVRGANGIRWRLA